MILIMSGSGQKRLFLKISLVPLRPPRPSGGSCRRPDSASRKGGRGAAFPLSLVDLFNDNDRPFARLNHIGSVLALDVAIVTQARRLPIDRFGEGTDLHGFRQALPDSEPGSCAAAAGGPLLYLGRTSMFADDFPILVGKVICAKTVPMLGQPRSIGLCAVARRQSYRSRGRRSRCRRGRQRNYIRDIGAGFPPRRLEGAGNARPLERRCPPTMRS